MTTGREISFLSGRPRQVPGNAACLIPPSLFLENYSGWRSPFATWIGLVRLKKLEILKLDGNFGVLRLVRMRRSHGNLSRTGLNTAQSMLFRFVSALRLLVFHLS